MIPSNADPTSAGARLAELEPQVRLAEGLKSTIAYFRPRLPDEESGRAVNFNPHLNLEWIT